MRDRLATQFLDLSGGFLGAPQVAIGDEEIGALLRESNRGGAADTAGAAGNQGILVFQSESHRHCSFARLIDLQRGLRTLATTSRRQVSALSGAGGVETPTTRSSGRNEEEEKAIEHGKLALIDERQPVFQAVCHPVGKRHETRAEKRGRTREETERDEHAAEELD